jgi:hypothetical protein
MLSVMEITSRLAKDAVFMTDLEKAFIRKLEEKQGAIPLYRRITKDFNYTELEGFPIPDSKPPEQEKGESNADYKRRLLSSNAIYDYIPESVRNGQKIPAHYQWNDIADGLNTDNIENLENLGKLKSVKVTAEEKAMIRAKSPLYQNKSMAQIEGMHKTAKDRRSTFRKLVKDAFKLHLQIQRIDDDYKSVEVDFHVVEGAKPDADGFLPIETTSAPILVKNAAQPMFGEPFTVASFLRLNVDKALSDDTQPGTYDALLRSGGKPPEAETPTGDGEGVNTYGRDQINTVYGTMAATMETKLGRDMLANMLAEKGMDDFVKSFGRTFHAMAALFVGTTVGKRYEKLIREEEEAEEALAKGRKAELDAALAKDGKAA